MEKRKRATLGRLLAAAFFVAMVMGPGPGVYLVNPDPADPDATVAVLGMPVIYLWSVFWFLVQAVVVITAYVVLWRDAEEAA